MTESAETHLPALVALTRDVGAPERGWALLAEGNTSLRTADDRMLVKATGTSMRDADRDSFVEVDLDAYWDVIDGAPQPDGEATGDDVIVSELFARATTWGAGRPSVESVLHAVCQRVAGVRAVVHTHPVPVNALLCSDQAELLAAGSLFPDQIVVAGRHPLLVPYVDPGLPLARDVARRLRAHIEHYGAPPRVIYLQNHGMFALAATAEEAVAVTEMTVKCAEILCGILAIGAPRFMTEAQADRIDTRPDELLRRAMLAERSE